MDAIQPVGTLVNPPNLAQGFAPLSALLGVQRQQQQLQAGAAEVQQQQQTAQQRKAIAGIDWSKYDDGTGTISTDKMLADPELRARSGDQFLQVLQAGATARQTQIQNKQQLQNLRASSRVQFASTMGPLYDDPDVQEDNQSTGAGRQKVRQTIADFGKLGPEEAQIAGIYGKVVDHAPPGGLARGVRAIELQALDANGQIEKQTPEPYATTNKAGQTQFVNKNPNAGMPVGAPLGRPVEQGLTPTQRPEYLGGIANIDKDAQRYDQISSEAQNSKQMMSLSEQVAALSDQVRTGKYSKAITDYAATIGQHDPAITARQMLGKYAAQLKLMAQQGATTDAGRSEVDSAMPNPDTMTPDAIKDAARYIGGIGAMRQARSQAASDFVRNNRGTNGMRAQDEQFTRSNDAFGYMYQRLPAGAERQRFLLNRFGDGTKITDVEGAKAFVQHQKELSGGGR